MNRFRVRKRRRFRGGRHSPFGALGSKKIALVGSPNTGKSVMFHNLTGSYATVSNYPGTTVEVSRGKGKVGNSEVEVVDTPGTYALLPITEDERVARSILLDEKPEQYKLSYSLPSAFLTTHHFSLNNASSSVPLT